MCQFSFGFGGNCSTSLSLLQPILILAIESEFTMGHQYFLGAMSGTTSVTCVFWDLRNLISGPINTNGGKA